jgi:hypothetical protein
LAGAGIVLDGDIGVFAASSVGGRTTAMGRWGQVDGATSARVVRTHHHGLVRREVVEGEPPERVHQAMAWLALGSVALVWIVSRVWSPGAFGFGLTTAALLVAWTIVRVRVVGVSFTKEVRAAAAAVPLVVGLLLTAVSPPVGWTIVALALAWTGFRLRAR